MRTVGNWELDAAIGSGSFAVVWRAKNKESGLVAAVKEIHTAKLTGKLQASLASEVSVLQRTSHRNLVGLIDIVKEDDRLFLVLEFCAGGDLGHFLRRYGPVPEACAQHLLQQLADGLQALRAQNLMHRDLKPQNLLLCDGSAAPQLKIADFGFARSLQPQGLAETLCGSPLYMAPEILQFHKYDAKADLWSVGAILFELLTGKPPFNGGNHLQLLQNIERGEGGRLPAGVAAKLSPPCKQLLQQLLRRNPLERISYKEFFSHPFLTQTPRQAPGSVPAPPPQPNTTAGPMQGVGQAGMRQDNPQIAARLLPARVASPTPGHNTPAAAAAGTTQAQQSAGAPRVAYTGPLLGVHEATGISVRTAVMQPPTSPPPMFHPPTHRAPNQPPATAQASDVDTAGAQQGQGYGNDASTAGEDGLQYTDIDLGPSPCPSPAPGAIPHRGHDPPPGGLSVIEECDDYVVISTETSPTSSTYAVQGGPTGAYGTGTAAGNGGRGRAAWDALSRVGPALLPPRLVASAASQLRNAAAASHQTWAGPLGQLASHVAHGGMGGPGRHSAMLPPRTLAPASSTTLSAPPTSASVPSLQNSPLTPISAPTPTPGTATPKQLPSTPTPAPPPALPAPSLAHLMRIPEGVDLLDLGSRVLHILGQAAAKAWDQALREAELAAAEAAMNAGASADHGMSQTLQGHTAHDAKSGEPEQAHVGSGGVQGSGTETDEDSRLQAAVNAAAAILRPAAAEIVAMHLLCGQLLAAALDAVAAQQAAGTGAGMGAGAGVAEGVAAGVSPRSPAAGSGTGPRQQHMLLASLGRSVLGSLESRSSLASLHVPRDQRLLGGTALLYRCAAQLSRTAAMDELMGHYGASVHQYAKAADLLLFLLLTTQPPTSSTASVTTAAASADADSADRAAGPTSSSGKMNPSTWAHVLHVLPGHEAGHVHQLYVAVRIRQSACMSDLNHTLSMDGN